MSEIQTAFVLGAGLGTRLRPLTLDRPKPLLPVRGRPMITYAFDNVLRLGVTRIVVNTHHCPERYAEAFPDGSYRGVPLTFVHEPVLLDTGGGLRGAADSIGHVPMIVHNGDILTTLPLEKLVAHHAAHPAEVTLAVRSAGPLHLGLDEGGALADIRGRLGNAVVRSVAFTGVYVVEPAFFARFQSGVVESVIPKFLDLVREGNPPGICLIDEGEWMDLGTLEEYERENGKNQGPTSKFQ